LSARALPLRDLLWLVGQNAIGPHCSRTVPSFCWFRCSAILLSFGCVANCF